MTITEVKPKPLTIGKCSRVFTENLEAFRTPGKKRALNQGGTSSTKTWSVLQLLIVIGEYAKENMRITVASESLPHLKRGCIDTFKKIMGEAFIDSRWNRSDFIYDFGKAILEFVPCDSPGKFAGPRRDILFINECNAIPYELFSQADMRTSKFVFLDWNPTSEFWVHEYDMINADDNVFIHSTYKDALEIGVLEDDIVEKIESFKKTDPNLWKVYGLGQLGESEGLVFPDYEIIYDHEFPKEGTMGYGLDFGWTDVTALGKFCIKGDGLYGHQLIYDKNLNADQIDARLTELGLVKHGLPIWADSNNPEAIDYLYKSGWNIKPVKKGKDSVQMGIDACKRYKQYWTESSLDAIKEQRNYRYVKKYDKIANKYIQTNNTTHQWSHCLVAGTMVETRQGEVPIEHVAAGDDVLTRQGWQQVVASGITNPSANVVKMELSNGREIIGTPDHLIYVEGMGYIPLHACRYGDVLHTPNQSTVPVYVVGIQKLNNKQTVYDLTVKNAHEFFAQGVLVHNCMDARRYFAHMTKTQLGTKRYRIF